MLSKPTDPRDIAGDAIISAIAAYKAAGYSREDLLTSAENLWGACEVHSPAPQGYVETRTHLTNSKGHLVPIDLVKPTDLLVDQQVREIFNFAKALESQIARFRSHTYDDLGALEALLAEQYGVKFRGRKPGGKGNISFRSYDGLIKVEISVQDYMEYGPELQFARQTLDEYFNEVGSAAPDELRTLLEFAFPTDKPGKVDRSMLYAMRRLDIKHPLFRKAMDLVQEAQWVASTRDFVRISTRQTPTGAFRSMQINLANAVDHDAEDQADE